MQQRLQPNLKTHFRFPVERNLDGCFAEKESLKDHFQFLLYFWIFCHSWKILQIKTNTQSDVVSMEDVEELHILIILFYRRFLFMQLHCHTGHIPFFCLSKQLLVMDDNFYIPTDTKQRLLWKEFLVLGLALIPYFLITSFLLIYKTNFFITCNNAI